MFSLDSPRQVVDRCQKVMAHAWVARAFVRHSDEVEEFPELGEIGRAIFDLARALEAKVHDPPAYLKMLSKKLGKFRRAVEQFAVDAPKASAHTNFAQTIASLRTCVDDLDQLQSIGLKLLAETPPVAPEYEE